MCHGIDRDGDVGVAYYGGPRRPHYPRGEGGTRFLD